MFVFNSSMIKYNVNREIIKIPLDMYRDLFFMRNKDVESILSPRYLNSRKTAYLSNGLVCWLNCRDLSFEDVELEWSPEIRMLKKKGLKFGEDMIIVKWMGSYLFLDDHGNNIDCPWIKLISVSGCNITAFFDINPSTKLKTSIKLIKT